MKQKKHVFLLAMILLLFSVISNDKMLLNAAPVDGNNSGSDEIFDFDNTEQLISSETAPTAIPSVSENQIWSGTITGEKYFSFTPVESGMYYCEVDESKLPKDCYCLCRFDYEDRPDPYQTFRESNYLFEGNTYYFSVEVYKSDEDYNSTYSSGEISFVIHNSKDIMYDITNGKAMDTASEGEHVYYYHSDIDGMKTFNSGIDINFAIIEVDNSTETVNEIDRGGCKTRKFEVKKGYDYYFICNTWINTNKPFAVSVSDGGKLIKSIKVIKFESGYNTIGDVTTDASFDRIFDNYNLSIEIAYVDGTKGTVDFSQQSYSTSDDNIYEVQSSPTVSEYDLGISYTGKTRMNYWGGEAPVPGSQPVIIGILGYKYIADTSIYVKKHIELDYSKIKFETKLAELNNSENDIWWMVEPDTSGFYWFLIYDGVDMFDMYQDTYFELYDPDDNIVEYAVGDGWKLKAGQKYVLHFHHGEARSDTSYKFFYAVGKNTDHSHTFGDWKTTKASTYSEEGIMTRTCTACGYEETKSIEKLVKPVEQPVKPVEQQIVPTSSTPKTVVLKNGGLRSVKNNKKKTIQVKWKSVTGASGYEIQYALNKKFSKGKKTKVVKSAKKTSLTIKKLKKGKTYYVRIRSYALDGNKKVYGAWSAKKKIKIKK